MDEDDYDEEVDENEFDEVNNKKAFNKLYNELSFSHGKHVPQDDEFQKKLK